MGGGIFRRTIMNKKQFLTGIFGIVLVLGLIVIGCDNGTTDNENTGTTTRIDAPRNFKVSNKKATSGGLYSVTLVWDVVPGANHYEVGYADTSWNYENSSTGRYTFEDLPAGKYDFSIQTWRKRSNQSYDAKIDLSTEVFLRNVSVP
jgi:hypothetical protein